MSRIASRWSVFVSFVFFAVSPWQSAVAQQPAAAPQHTAQAATAADTVDVQHVMDAFHQAVVSHDGERIRSLFLPDGSTWLNVLTDDAYARAKAAKPDVAKVRVSNFRDFATFVSTTHSSLDPRHSNIQIHSDGTIASVYFDFVFLIDGKDENHGSETWQLVKGAQGWRIAAITYSSDPHPQPKP